MQLQSSKCLLEKALTIAEPWAWAVVSSFKQLENRTWSTSFRGRVAVHSSLSAPYLGDVIEEIEAYDERIAAALDHESIDPEAGRTIFGNGCIVGSVEVVDCVAVAPDGTLQGDEYREAGYEVEPYRIPSGFWVDFSEDEEELAGRKPAAKRFAFLLAGARRYRTPIPAQGKLNFWALSEVQRAAVELAERDLLLDPGQPYEFPAGHDPRQFLARVA